MSAKILLQRAAAALGVLVCLLVMFAAPLQAQVVISQVYGSGGNTGAPLKYDYIELFNRGASDVSLAGWSVQYASATGSSWTNKTPLSGTIQAGHYLLIQEASSNVAIGADLPVAPDITGSINMSGSAGKLALVNNNTSLTGTCPLGPSVVDLLGYGSTANCSEPSGASPAPGLGLAVALLRIGGGCTDNNNNSSDFITGTPAARNSALAAVACSAPTPPSFTTSSSPSLVVPGDPVLLSVLVVPGANPTSTGLTVTVDLSLIGGASQTFTDDGHNGDAVAGDGTYSYQATLAGTLTPGTFNLPVTVSDAQLRSSTGTIALVVKAAPRSLAIHDIQGNSLTSPYQTQFIETTGIVTAVASNGFFIQAPDYAADSDPGTSEGVFVYTGGGAPAAAAVGNEVVVRGTVQEYVPAGYPAGLAVTEIGGTVSAKLVSTGNPLPTPVAITAADLGATPDRTHLEQFEGMLVHVDSLTSVGPTGSAGNTSDGIFYAVFTGTARPFREPGMSAAAIPAGMPGIPVFDDNQERLAVNTSRLASPLEISSGTTIGNVTGVLDTNGFTILVPSGAALNVAGGMTPAPVRVAGDREFTVATFNLLNLGSSGVTADRVAKAAAMIRDLMHLPDVLGVEEMKDLATLNLLAGALNNGPDPKPVYTAYVGTTGGTQNVGLLVNTARVQVTDVTQVGVDAQYYGPTSANPNVSAWYTTFDRAPLVLHATVTPPIGQPYPVTVIVNHLRSLLDIDDATKGPFVWAKRQAGAAWLANYLSGLQAAGEHVITVGDFNAYQFNDGYVDVLGTLMGTPALPGQALVTGADLIDPDLVDLVNTVDSTQRYSYVEEGSAQAIDHVVVTSNLLARPAALEYARNDADFPASYLNRTDRPERVSDHDPAVAYFTFPPPQADLATTIAVAGTSALSGSTQGYAITVSNLGPDPALNPKFEDTVPAHTSFQSLVAPAGWTCTTPAIGGTGKVSCTASTLAANASAQFTLSVAIDCAVADGTTVSNLASAASDYDDPTPGNNAGSATFTVSNPVPVLGAVNVDKPVLSPPNHQLIDVFLDYALSDNCGVPGLQVAVTSNQSLNGTGDGNTASDWQVIDAHHVLLRAERAPDSAAGRTYTITVTATDGMGPAVSRTVNVLVPRSSN